MNRRLLALCSAFALIHGMIWSAQCKAAILSGAYTILLQRLGKPKISHLFAADLARLGIRGTHLHLFEKRSGTLPCLPCSSVRN